jgi:hypothetical protein
MRANIKHAGFSAASVNTDIESSVVRSPPVPEVREGEFRNHIKGPIVPNILFDREAGDSAPDRPERMSHACPYWPEESEWTVSQPAYECQHR